MGQNFLTLKDPNVLLFWQQSIWYMQHNLATYNYTHK